MSQSHAFIPIFELSTNPSTINSKAPLPIYDPKSYIANIIEPRI
jgi:hypothetical protein